MSHFELTVERKFLVINEIGKGGGQRDELLESKGAVETNAWCKILPGFGHVVYGTISHPGQVYLSPALQ